MEYIAMIIVSIITILILKFAWKIEISKIKKLKELGYDKTLNEITNQLPENKEICQDILKKLNNEKVMIKESVDNTASLYIAISNTILIANIKKTFTRVQTIAHECLHSIQDRRTLLFNFFFSNVYLVYFLAICILTILKLNFYPMLSLFGLVIASFIYYAIRSSLEMDAMTKAKPLTEKYLKEKEILSKEEQAIIIENCEEINKIAIPLTNFQLIVNCLFKIILYCIFAFIFV